MGLTRINNLSNAGFSSTVLIAQVVDFETVLSCVLQKFWQFPFLTGMLYLTAI